MSDSQTYDTPCSVCGKVLDGHTHDPRELSIKQIKSALAEESKTDGYVESLAPRWQLIEWLAGLLEWLEAAEKQIEVLRHNARLK
jgi:DNA-binding transcriptional MerR regulator